MLIKDTTAIVTGASSGIGRAVALGLARRGSRVALLARRHGELDAVAAEIDALGGRALAVVCDVTDPDAVHGAVTTVEGRLGAIDILVTCAGDHVWRPFEATGEVEHRRMMAVNYWGTFHCIRAVLPRMRERRLAQALSRRRRPSGVLDRPSRLRPAQFPVFLALTVRLDALWPRLGDLFLSRWGLLALLGVWLLYRVLAS